MLNISLVFILMLPLPVEILFLVQLEVSQQETTPTLTFQAIKFLKVLYQLVSHFQKLYGALKLVHLLIMIDVENQFHHQNHQRHLMKDTISTIFFISDLNLLSCLLDNFTFKNLYLLIYINIVLNQNKTRILSWFFLKSLEEFFLLLQ